MRLFPADDVVAALTDDGFARADVVAVIDSLIDAGLTTPRTDDGPNFLTVAELDLVREQLRGADRAT